MGSKRLTPTSGKNGLKMFVVVVVVVVHRDENPVEFPS